MDVLAVVKRSPIVVPLACAAALAMLLISEGSYWQSASALQAMSAAGTGRASLRGLQQSLLTAMEGQRNFALTGRHEDLDPYKQALREVDESLRFLDRHYDGKPGAHAVLDKLHALIEARLAVAAATIERQIQEHGAGMVLRSSDLDRQQMDAIRALGAELLELETASLAAGQADLVRMLQVGRIGVAVLSLISLLALYLYLRQTRALDEQRRLQQLQVRQDRDRLELEVRQRTAQLTELARHLQNAREDERNKLARDLHDELGALLTSAKLDAARIRSRLAGSAPEALERLAHLVATLDTVIALKRRISEDLRPSALGHLGLVATLEILAREFAERSDIEVHCALDAVPLDASTELVVYRVAQEAITNISKYAKASRVWLTLGERDGMVEVTVRDDGVGFDSGASNGSAFGLVGMRFRVEAEGGTLSVTTAPGLGTLLRATFPPAHRDTPPATP